MFRRRLISCLLLLILLASACRGTGLEPTAASLRAKTSSSPTISRPTVIQPTATKVATSLPSPVTASDELPQPEIAALRQVMLEAINADRTAHGLSPVAWDETAARAGQGHAEEMASAGYFSHWDLSGHGPDYRYAQAGGQDAVMENIYTYWYRYSDGRPAPIEDWAQVIREAEASLMQSPGHRQNILDPAHTHLGVGIAYNADTGEVKMTQEFVNRYVALHPLPAAVPLGTEIVLQGDLLPGASEPLVNLAYEPFPQPKLVHELNAGIYVSPAEVYQAIRLVITGNDHFSAPLTLSYENQPGLYHVRTWLKIGGRQIMASNIMIEVR